LSIGMARQASRNEQAVCHVCPCLSYWPKAVSLIGIAIIMDSGPYMIHRERVTARKSITQRAAPPI
jgi:hypothetical protein